MSTARVLNISMAGGIATSQSRRGGRGLRGGRRAPRLGATQLCVPVTRWLPGGGKRKRSHAATSPRSGQRPTVYPLLPYIGWGR
eukprot:scaffold3586_cov404-Prasinococcus_capsulatus_cf.AAC.30